MSERRHMRTSKKQGIYLVGDIGGTKTNLCHFTEFKDAPRLQQLETFASEDAEGLEEILARYLDNHRIEVKAACFGIAGPVMDGRCKTTNLPWEVSEEGLRQRFGWSRIRLMNDLAATALSIPLLSPDQTAVINAGRPVDKQPIALLAPGTGLGQSLLLWVEGRYEPVPSEGGHSDFAPTTGEEVELWRYLHAKLGHVSVERVASGPGLVSIYSWLKTVRGHSEPGWLKRQLQDEDPAAVIARAGLNEKDPLCLEALNRFVSVLGSAAGNLALTGFARGGVYLGGGIPPKILAKLEDGIFLQAFLRKGRFEKFLANIPVHVILNEKAALLGAARCAARLAG